MRFDLDRNNINDSIPKGITNFEEALSIYFKSESCKLRTRYDNSINESMKVFNKEDIYIGIYENMFEPSNIHSLSSFLGIDPYPEFANTMVNKTKSTVHESHYDHEIKEYYSDVYEYCFQAFPETKTLWNG